MVPSSVLFPDKLYIYIHFNCTLFTTLDVKVHPALASTWGALGQIAATDYTWCNSSSSFGFYLGCTWTDISNRWHATLDVEVHPALPSTLGCTWTDISNRWHATLDVEVHPALPSTLGCTWTDRSNRWHAVQAHSHSLEIIPSDLELKIIKQKHQCLVSIVEHSKGAISQLKQQDSWDTYQNTQIGWNQEWCGLFGWCQMLQTDSCNPTPNMSSAVSLTQNHPYSVSFAQRRCEQYR